jgi:hypothetical protein
MVTEAKGGTFAPRDMDLIKKALTFYAKHCLIIEEWDEKALSNLLHRLNRIK